ncbi:hypothetical protein LAS9624_01126 [Latilactobacillus sakei]|nr:hypothetical protein LAS9624_01126 [Latilactobacillus sakei]
MTIRIFLYLLVASIKPDVKIPDSYSHLAYMLEKNWIKSIPGELLDIPNALLFKHTGRYTITTLGKTSMFTFRNNVITWFISILALIISLFAYFKK